jgi:Putative phage tail protein
MTGILGLGTEAKKKNVVASLRYQTSQKGAVIPLVYGANRIAVNLLDYQNFNSNGKSAKGGKGGVVGGGGGKAGGQTNYQVDFIAGLCQGPVNNFGLLWYNKTVTTLEGGTGISFSTVGSDGQTTDSYWTTNYPNNAINYSGTAFFTGDQYQLGQSPALPNFNVEVYGMEYGTAPNGCDANPANIVIDLLTNSRYGAEFPLANLDTAGSLADYANYCNAVGFMLAPVYDSQQAASQMLAEIAAVTNSAIIWSGGLLKIIPYGDKPLSAIYISISFTGALNQGDQLFLTIDGPFAGAPVSLNHYLTANDIVSYEAAGASLAMLITGDGTVADPGNSSLAAAGLYASVTTFGLAIVSTQGIVPTITTSASGSETLTVSPPSAAYTWMPDTTPIYTLGEDDYIVQESSVGSYLGVTPGGPALRMGAGPITGGFTDDPVHITRSTPADALNMVQLETTDRGTSYNTNITEVFDQGSIDLYGVRRDTSVKARAIVDPYFVATIAAQLVLQRQILYRNTYSFRLGWKYILLEPMDLVQITDQRLGAQALTVRITAIEEDVEGTLSVTAEDWFGTPGAVLYPPVTPIATFDGVTMLGSGGATATPYPKQGGASEATANNAGQTAPSVNPPFIMEPTAQLLAARGQTSPYIIIGLSGGPNGSYSDNWGGAAIYISLDGSTFSLAGEQTGASVMGYTTADCGPSGPSLAVNLTESNGSLTSVSPQLAANGVSLCALRTPAGALEFLSYTTATLTGGNQYTLTGLYRGLYGTYAVDLPAGSQFLALAAGTFFYEVLPSQFVGQTLYFEFPSFNPTGGGAQPLSATTVYSYVPVGSSVVPGVFPQIVMRDAGVPSEIGSGSVSRDIIVALENQ